MFDLLISTAPKRNQSLAPRGRTPNDARALNSLEVQDGRTMRSLADEWGCDASNATWIVDRLENMGLAERRTIPQDRRVKLVALTLKGLKLRTDLLEEFHAAPEDFQKLSRAELETLEQLLQELKT